MPSMALIDGAVRPDAARTSGRLPAAGENADVRSDGFRRVENEALVDVAVRVMLTLRVVAVRERMTFRKNGLRGNDA